MVKKGSKVNKYICRIHDVKPEHLSPHSHFRKYPRSKNHAEETGCRGFEFVLKD